MQSPSFHELTATNRRSGSSLRHFSRRRQADGTRRALYTHLQAILPRSLERRRRRCASLASAVSVRQQRSNGRYTSSLIGHSPHSEDSRRTSGARKRNPILLRPSQKMFDFSVPCPTLLLIPSEKERPVSG